MQTKNTFNTKKLGLFGLVTVATLGATALANAETYTVQKGDTLSAIAMKVTKRPTQIFLLQRQLLRKKSLNVSQVVATQPKTDNIMDVINYLHHI